MTDREVRVILPEEHYTLFNTSRQELPEVIVVNDALLTFQHTDVFPWHLDIQIDAQDFGDNGMPTPDESAALFELGDAMQSELVGRNALFLARSTWNAIRELSFRVHDPEVADSILREMLDKKPHAREWEYRMQHDPEWHLAGYIFKLFPLANGADA